jgi:hypothetical protein
VRPIDMLHGRVCVTPVGNRAGIKTDEIEVEGRSETSWYTYTGKNILQVQRQ